MTTRRGPPVTLATAVALVAYSTSSGVPQPNPDLFETPFRITADGKPIDVDVGHAAPLYTDFDGDGVRDLLVGQFEGGYLRVYRNHGTDTSPRFEDFALFETRKALGSVPSG